MAKCFHSPTETCCTHLLSVINVAKVGGFEHHVCCFCGLKSTREFIYVEITADSHGPHYKIQRKEYV